MKKEMDLYSDYFLSSFGQVTATGLSNLLDGALSHDRITRFLSGNVNSSMKLWHEVKPMVRENETEDACLIFDDTIINKPYTDENDLISWRRDHSKGHNEKGLNLLTTFYHTQLPGAAEALRVPAAFECVKKTVRFCDEKTLKEKQKSPVTKDEMMRSMLKHAVENQHLKFRYVLADRWFSSSDNLLFIHRMKKHFIMDMKNNRLSMFSTQDRNRGRWTGLDKLPLQPGQPVKVWIKDLEIEVLLCKFIFTDKDGSAGEMYMASNDLKLSADSFRTLYRKRWNVEEYHKSLKQNDSLAKSPTRTVTAQTSHLFAALLAYIKICFSTLKSAWNELEAVKNYMSTQHELNK
jgi:hypothetical protein